MTPGTRFGPYEIVAPIGAGGMGEVYRARDTRLGRDVAIKVLPPEFADDPERLRRFEQEARAVAALSHPNVLALFDVGSAVVSLRGAEGPEAISAQTSGLPRPQSGLAVTEGAGEVVHFLVTELLEGESLRDRLKAGGLTVRKAVETGVQIAQGLAAAHEKGIVHRDLKPGNVFVTRDGQVKILDFGLARLEQPEIPSDPHATTLPGEPATESGAVLGTMGYTSPEQLRGERADARSDIFAFGCVLYEMLSGRSPFLKATGAETVTAIMSEDPAPLSGTGRVIAPALQEIVSRCLEKRPADRFSSAHDLALALRAESPALVTAAAVRRHVGRRWWLWAGVAALGVIAAAAVAFYVFTLRGHAGAPTAAGLIRSIAVLPLANLSGDPTQEYFSDGMTEELIATLSKISSLKVISRTSVMQFKGSKKSLREIAAALGVEGVIEGSVLRAGERVRITAQLINASTDTHLWAESYDRDLKDVLALQSDVARTVAGEVQAKLTPQEQTRLAGGRPVNPEAYELCLKGWHFRWEDNAEGFLKAIEYFQRAIKLDPSYAPAHAGLADAYSVADLFNLLPFEDAMPKAKAAARRALELDESLAEAHGAAGLVAQMFDWDWAGAEREYRRALELKPNNAAAFNWYAWFLANMKRFDEAIAMRKRAVELDPLSVAANDFFGWTLYYAGRYDESIRQYRKALEMDPKNAYLHMWLSRSYAAKQERADALAECRTALELAPDDLVVLIFCGQSLAISGSRQEARAMLDRVNVLAARKPVDPYLLACLYVGLGDKERALELLERAFKEHSPNLVGDPDIDFGQDLGSDPRYQALRHRLNLPASCNQ